MKVNWYGASLHDRHNAHSHVKEKLMKITGSTNSSRTRGSGQDSKTSYAYTKASIGGTGPGNDYSIADQGSASGKTKHPGAAGTDRGKPGVGALGMS